MRWTATLVRISAAISSSKVPLPSTRARYSFVLLLAPPLYKRVRRRRLERWRLKVGYTYANSQKPLQQYLSFTTKNVQLPPTLRIFKVKLKYHNVHHTAGEVSPLAASPLKSGIWP